MDLEQICIYNFNGNIAKGLESQSPKLLVI